MQTPHTYVVTIGRQFGCGGREIGRIVAQKLGIAYYDKELLTEVAQHSGMSNDFFSSLKISGVRRSIASSSRNSLSNSVPAAIAPAYFLRITARGSESV